MKVLLTGATGFIGSHVARLLIQKSCHVYVLVRPGSDTRRIAAVLPDVRVIACGLNDTGELAASLREIRPEVCIHLAWSMVPGKILTAPDNIDSLQGSLFLATELANLGCKKFVVAGTCFEYDTEQGYLSESSFTRPRNLYAASKLALHTVLEQFAGNTGMAVSWLRFFYLYGPFEDEARLVPAVILSLLRNTKAKVTSGAQVRDYLHVADAAAAVWAVMESALTGVVNVGSGRPVTVRDMVAQIGALCGRPELLDFGALAYRPGDPMFVCANNRRLVENTTWTPQFTLEQGLAQTINWWRAHEAATP